MRRAVVRQAVGADHGVLEAENALHVLLVHREVDRPCGQQFFHGVFNRKIHLPGNFQKIFPGKFRVRLRPGHQHLRRGPEAARGEDRGRGAVGIAVEADLLRAHGLLDDRQGLGRAAVVRLAGQLVVRDHHRYAELAPDAEGLLERIDDAVALVAHVRAVDAFPRRKRPAHLDHFLGRRGARRLVVQAGREADRARRERLVHHVSHRGYFARRCGLLEIVHRLHAQHRVADEQRAVGGRRLRPQRLDIFLERFEMKPRPFAVHQVKRRRHRLRHAARCRRERHAAVPRHHRGDALAHLRRHVGRREHQPVVVRVRVDEAGRGDPAAGIDLDLAFLLQFPDPGNFS